MKYFIVVFLLFVFIDVISALIIPIRRGKKPFLLFGKFFITSSVFRLVMVCILFGVLDAVIGRPSMAAGLSVLTAALLVFGSWLKRNILGEPLMFSDVAVIGAFFVHPRFYLGAIPALARAALVTGIALVGVSVLSLLLVDIIHLQKGAALAFRLEGVGLFSVGWIGQIGLDRSGLARVLLPHADLDLGEERYGLLATIMLGWSRWKQDRRRQLPVWACVAKHAVSAPPLVVVVQCESFADPSELGVAFSQSCELPNLRRAAQEGKSGRLQVSGFGAYTMRTEYGVLFGHEESALGFRRFDPYLTAREQAENALAARLEPVIAERVFLHPHSLAFYGRDSLMPLARFSRLIGESEFHDLEHDGSHVSDLAIGDRILTLIDDAVSNQSGTFVFAVTIENHGPWSGGVNQYLHHLKHGDDLLGRLRLALEHAGRDALLVFYGDHRPSIPGAVLPGGMRHTPVIMEGFGAYASMPGLQGNSLTPAALHHRIIDVLQARVQ